MTDILKTIARTRRVHSQLLDDPEPVLAMCDVIEEAVEVLENIEGLTYKTELCNTDKENWSIVQGHLSTYNLISRKALKSIASKLGEL